jgi:hypothetical protein
MEETPTISKVSVKLSGVKTTLNKLAVKLELAWQVFRDLVSINRMAEALERKERRDVRKTKGERNIEFLMAAVVLLMVAARGAEERVLLSRDYRRRRW